MDQPAVELLVHIASPTTFMVSKERVNPAIDIFRGADHKSFQADRRYKAVAQSVVDFQNEVVSRVKVADIHTIDALKGYSLLRRVDPREIQSPSIASTVTVTPEEQARIETVRPPATERIAETPSVIDLTKDSQNVPRDALQSSRKPSLRTSKPGSRFLLGINKLPSKNRNPPFKQPSRIVKQPRIEAYLKGLETPIPRPRTAPESTSNVQVPWSGPVRRRAYSDSSPSSTMSFVPDTTFEKSSFNEDGLKALETRSQSDSTTNHDHEISSGTVRVFETTAAAVTDLDPQHLASEQREESSFQTTSEGQPSLPPVFDQSTQELQDDPTIPMLNKQKRSRLPEASSSLDFGSGSAGDVTTQYDSLLAVSSQPPPTTSDHQELSFSSQTSDLPFHKKRRLTSRVQDSNALTAHLPIVPESSQFDLDRALHNTTDGIIFNRESLEDWTSSAKPSTQDSSINSDSSTSTVKQTTSGFDLDRALRATGPGLVLNHDMFEDWPPSSKASTQDSNSTSNSLASTVEQTPSPTPPVDHTYASFTFDETQSFNNSPGALQADNSGSSQDNSIPAQSQESWHGFSPSNPSTPRPFAAIHALPDEVNPPSPSSLSPSERRTYITPYLHEYANPYRSFFDPVKVTRDVPLQERGHWDLKLRVITSQEKVNELRSSPPTPADNPAPWASWDSDQLANNTDYDVRTWSDTEFAKFWKNVSERIQSGELGRNTRMIRVPLPSTSTSISTLTSASAIPQSSTPSHHSTSLQLLIRIFCPGEVLAHIAIALNALSQVLTQDSRMVWYGVDNIPVVYLWGGPPTGLDVGRWCRKVVLKRTREAGPSTGGSEGGSVGGGSGSSRKVVWGVVESERFWRDARRFEEKGVDSRAWEWIVR